MRRISAFITLACLLTSCVSVQKSVNSLTALHDPGKLKLDVDFAYNKLKKLHPRLYEYTKKEALDFKFDSLKRVLSSPLSSREFYFKLSPVVAAVRQGHTRIQPPEPKMGIGELFYLGVEGRSPLFWYDMEMFNDRLYIFKNYTGDTTLKPGTEIVTINGRPPAALLSEFRPTLASDGFGEAFTARRLNRDFAYYQYYKEGIADSVPCQLKYKDTVSTVYLKRKYPYKPEGAAKTKEQVEADKVHKQLLKDKQKEQGYDTMTKSYIKDLTFCPPDSTIAILRVKNFMEGNFSDYYKKCFHLLDSLKTETLILDIRDNPGGLLTDARELMSYLADTTFAFLGKSEVRSKTSIMQSNYFRGNPLFMNVIMAIGYPMQLIIKGITMLTVNKAEDNKYYLTFPGSENGPANKKHFKGKLYVLINGGTFSAASTLASNLKALKRGIFVGEETGGSANGTVAGRMAVYKLPESKLMLYFGLAHIQARYKPGPEGRGVMPDVPVLTTLEDRIRGVDAAVEWVKGRANTH